MFVASCPESTKTHSILLSFPSLDEIMIVLHVVDGAGRYNDKAEDALSMKCLSIHFHLLWAAPVENTCLWALIQFSVMQ